MMQSTPSCSKKQPRSLTSRQLSFQTFPRLASCHLSLSSLPVKEEHSSILISLTEQDLTDHFLDARDYAELSQGLILLARNYFGFWTNYQGHPLTNFTIQVQSSTAPSPKLNPLPFSGYNILFSRVLKNHVIYIFFKS